MFSVRAACARLKGGSSGKPAKNKTIVLIDGREVDKKRGMGHFLRELLFNINENCSGDEFTYVCVIPKSSKHDVKTRLDNITFIRFWLPDPIVWEQCLVPVCALYIHADWIICPYNTFPLLKPVRARRVIIYHDLIFLQYRRIKSNWKLAVGNRYRATLFKYLSGKDIILTVSDYSRELIGRFALRNATVIGNDINHLRELFSASPSIEPPYFLHVGGDASTKNSALVLAAYRLARSRSARKLPRLIVIGVSPSYAVRLQNGQQREPDIEFRFHVSDVEKCRLFANTVAVVFPSLKEGFGLPIIEAHACGRRVVTSKRRPLSDLSGPGDILVSPSSQEEIAAAFARVAEEAKAPDHTSGLWAPPDQYQVLRSVLV